MRAATQQPPSQGGTPPLNLNVCELYAGVGGMSSILQALGWQAVMLCEIQPHLRLLLSHKFPQANVLGDMDTAPWLVWQALGLTALLVVAGISCQPFSDAGPKREQHDPRSDDALKVLQAAIALQSAAVLLENIPNFVDNDPQHGVFTRVCDAFGKAGYDLIRVTRRTHNQCGGRTTRKRLFILFAHRDRGFQIPTTALAATLSRAPAPLHRLKGHLRCNWATRGLLSDYPHRRSELGLLPSAYLQLGAPGYSVSEGSIVRLTDSQLWRVQTIAGLQLTVRSPDRRAPATPNKVPISQVLQHVSSSDSRYTVYDPCDTLPMIRASGEPPGYGAPLIALGPNNVRALSTDDRAVLNETDAADVEHLSSLGCSDALLWSAIGNSIPRSMVLDTLETVTLAAHALVDGAPRDARAAPTAKHQQHTPKPKPPSHTSARSLQEAVDSVTSPLEPGFLRIILLPISAEAHGPVVWLPDPHKDLAPFVDVPAAECGTGNVTKHVTHMLGSWALTASLALAGHCHPEEGGTRPPLHTVTVCTNPGSPLLGMLQPCTTHNLTGPARALEPPVALALACAATHGPGNITVADIAPLATDRRPLGGATAPSRVHTTRIANETAPAPSDIVARMQAIEADVDAALSLAVQQATSSASNGLASYLVEWREQITKASLEGVPPELLTQLPTFTDPRLASVPFSERSRLPTTEPLPPVPQQEPVPGFEPESEHDLIEPEAMATLDHGDERLKRYFDLQATPGVTKEELAAARPPPFYIGQSGIKPKARGRIWDNRGPKPVLMDMNAPISTHLNRAYFAKKAASLPWVRRDQQLLQQIDSGIQSQTDLPLQFRHQPPLLSLATGYKEVHSDLGRLRGLGYIRQHRRRPFIPNHTNPQGARAKKGTKKKRRVSEMGSPRKRQKDNDGNPVQPFNVNAKYFEDGSLKLPKEEKLRPQDIMSDGAVLRYIGDLICLALIAWTDDLRDFFNQLKLHPSMLWMLCFHWPMLASELDDSDGTLGYIVEHVLGFGLVFASNIAQRFANAVTHIFLQEFDKADEPHVRQERDANPMLNAWIEHRQRLPSHTPENRQDRLLTFGFYTDDSFSYALGAHRAVRAKVAWYKVTRTLNLLTAEPRKRLTGTRIGHCGVEYMPTLGLVIIPEAKTMAATQRLLECERGRCEVGTTYRPLMGLIQFLRFILRLPSSTVCWMLEPLRAGHEIDNGPATWVSATSQRVTQWKQWRHRLLAVQGVGFNAVLQETPEVQLTTRSVVWHGDAAKADAISPALCGYCHGLYWILPLQPHHLVLTIAALEFLTQLGNFLMFGPMLITDGPRGKDELLLLLQCDSLVSTCILANDAARQRVLVFIHQQLLDRCEFQDLRATVVVGHEFGERNVATDHGSRGRENRLREVGAAFGARTQRLPVSPAFVRIVDATVDFHNQPPDEHTMGQQAPP